MVCLLGELKSSSLCNVSLSTVIFLSDSFSVSLSKAFNEVFFEKKKKIKGESKVVVGDKEEEETKLARQSFNCFKKNSNEF